ncbi:MULTISPECIES: hypothetical protein [unclassified Frankia]|uniref:DUF7700 domain-containing protein n=1 Tax=unclassified Frankia TaxID=2632575 RepID=UPI000A8D2DEC|nr:MULTISPECIES: hypothetical protein [unclassified Frankia]
MGVGYRVRRRPIPPIEANTTWFDAGPLRIGVESRHLDDEVLRQAYGNGPSDIHVDDWGISIHVCGSVSGSEYLRFDCFEDEPHYHYIHPTDDFQVWVPFDEGPNGPMLDWALGCLANRTQEMLRRSGGAYLADFVDLTRLGETCAAVARLARSLNNAKVRPEVAA